MASLGGVRRTRAGCWGIDGREKLGTIWGLSGAGLMLPRWLVACLVSMGGLGRLASKKGPVYIFQACGLVVRPVGGELLRPSYTG